MKKHLSVTFTYLTGLQPTIRSCTLKVFEEIGELMRVLGKRLGRRKQY
ncbi:hypothetical protein [Desulfosporosinus metallidurans]|uniref:Uncharacterized protein n=1 Tax=Desulfosporosinus metallidurans TaxID=1888891 RepID=A0A1Q8QFF8_9FIRM|nr:hypothetical protein [Desulfosporosinus metallidurans]OLN26038.1 hypothetical protein DSOL_5153 [Desulfosporosinus metallidurans]